MNLHNRFGLRQLAVFGNALVSVERLFCDVCTRSQISDFFCLQWCSEQFGVV